MFNAFAAQGRVGRDDTVNMVTAQGVGNIDDLLPSSRSGAIFNVIGT